MLTAADFMGTRRLPSTRCGTLPELVEVIVDALAGIFSDHFELRHAVLNKLLDVSVVWRSVARSLLDQQLAVWGESAEDVCLEIRDIDFPSQRVLSLAIDIPVVKSHFRVKCPRPPLDEDDELFDPDQEVTLYQGGQQLKMPAAWGIDDSHAARAIIERCTGLRELLVDQSWRVQSHDKKAIEASLRGLVRLELICSASIDVGAPLRVLLSVSPMMPGHSLASPPAPRPPVSRLAKPPHDDAQH
jgi:hypothetical protein